MSKPRGLISESLAARGRPELWANETETAALCGMSYDVFSEKISDMERLGFPQKSEWNGKRFIPLIEQFWREQSVRPILQPSNVDSERQKENWS